MARYLGDHYLEEDMPESREMLRQLCRNEDIYAFTDLYKGGRFAKMFPFEKGFGFHSFEANKPNAKIFNLKEMLFRHNFTNTSIPLHCFFEIGENQNEGQGTFFVVITADNTLGGNNFMRTCSGLEDMTYKNFSLKRTLDGGRYYVFPSPCHIFGVSESKKDLKPMVQGHVYGNKKRISLQITNQDKKDYPIGKIVRGLERLTEDARAEYKIYSSGVIFF